MTRRIVRVNGHGIGVQVVGDADRPLVALVHGIACDSDSWGDVPALLAERAGVRVVAPELFAAGQAISGNGDFSLGAYAAGLRDVLFALGHDRATVVGHSLGGGVAMQYAYLFPHLVERLVLVSSGGLGRRVNPVLAAATLPGAELVVPLLATSRVRALGSAGLRAYEAATRYVPGATTTELTQVGRSVASFVDPQVRGAFLGTARHVMDRHGQRISARDRLPLADGVPLLLIHGERDALIPARHSARAHASLPGSRYVELRGTGHFPHLEQTDLFISTVLDWMTATEPAHLDDEMLKERLRAEAG